MKKLTRDDQRRRAANKAYRESRRQHKPKIIMVPKAGTLEDVDFEEGERVYGPQRAVLVPFKPVPIHWEAAREIGKATTRVLDQDPKWDKTTEDAIIAANIKRTEVRKILKGKNLPTVGRSFKGPTIQRREPKGEWWTSKLADLVERRVKLTKPSAGYHPRSKDEPEAASPVTKETTK